MLTPAIDYYQSSLPAAQALAHDPNLVSPASGKNLIFTADGQLRTADGRERYAIEDGILRLFVEEPDSSSHKITRTVQTFYEDAPFPNYNGYDSLESFLKRAIRGVFANMLAAQIPMNAKVLEVGCGTGQLSNYLAATTMAHFYAADMTLASLKLGREFAVKYDIPGITFLQMNLFRPCIRPASMDIVISNGVLHHTADTQRAFKSIAPLVKPGGHIIVGLYNWIGRVRTNLRRAVYRLVGERALVLDPHLRQSLEPEKRRAWINDQYRHPQERRHAFSEVLRWLEDENFAFVSSIPKIRGQFTENERLFFTQNPGTPFDRFAAALGMIFSHGGEGGLFIVIGRRK
jgi:SAM-dependent methyltransferase